MLARIISDALNEDKFSDTFNNGIDDRLNNMNDAQLAGIKKYLVPEVSNAKCKYIKEAFERTLVKTTKILVVREAIQEEIKKDEQSVNSKQYNKRRRIEDKEYERELVFANIHKTAKTKAVAEIEVYEKGRLALEKRRMIEAVPIAEKARRDYAIAGVVFLVTFITAAVVSYNLTGNIGILSGLLAAAVFFSVYLFRVAYYAGIVLERVVPQEEIETAIEVKEKEFASKAIREYQDREAKILQKEKEERAYRKKLRAEKRERDEVARKILEAERLEFLKLGAEEIAAANRAFYSDDGSRPPGYAPGKDDGNGNGNGSEFNGYFNDLKDASEALGDIEEEIVNYKNKKKSMIQMDPKNIDQHLNPDGDHQEFDHTNITMHKDCVMKLNLVEISCLNIRPIIDDGSGLYAKVYKTKYHIPRGKKHRVGENTPIMQTDVLANIGDEVTWVIVNVENRIQIVVGKKTQGDDPFDDFLYDENKIRQKTVVVKSQYETFSSSFEISDDEDLVVSIIKQVETDAKKIEEYVLGSAIVLGKLIREYEPNCDSSGIDGDKIMIVRDIAREDLYGFASIHFALTRKFIELNDDDEESVVSVIEFPKNDFYYKQVDIQTVETTLNIVTFKLSKELNKDSKNFVLSVFLRPPNLEFYGPVKKHTGFRHYIGPEENYTERTHFSLIHPSSFVLANEICFDYNLQDDDLSLNQNKITVDHTVCVALEEEIISVVIPDDDEDEVHHLNKIISPDSFNSKHNNSNSNSNSRPSSRPVSRPSSRPPSRPNSQPNSTQNSPRNQFTAERIGYELSNDIENGLIKPKHLVFSRNYLGGYEIPVSAILNAGPSTPGGNSYSVNGIALDDKLKPCGMISFEIELNLTEIIQKN